MSSLQVRNVPEEFHEELRAEAARTGKTIRSIVLEAIERELTRREFDRRLRELPTIEIGVSGAQLIEDARAERDGELDYE